MDCPNCKTPVKFFELIRINHKRPYNCPVCFKVSGFKHNKPFLNLIAGLAGLAGVILYYTIIKYGWLYGTFLIAAVFFLFVLIFLKYARLQVLETDNGP